MPAGSREWSAGCASVRRCHPARRLEPPPGHSSHCRCGSRDPSVRSGRRAGWLICRLLSFFDTAFFDAVEREKERYDKPAIELVAEKEGEIIGLLDLECESDGLAPRPGSGGTTGISRRFPITSDRESRRRCWLRQSGEHASEGSSTRGVDARRRAYPALVRAPWLRVRSTRISTFTSSETIYVPSTANCVSSRHLPITQATGVKIDEADTHWCMTTSGTRNGCDGVCSRRRFSFAPVFGNVPDQRMVAGPSKRQSDSWGQGMNG